MAITVSNTGYIKRTAITTYRNQRRGGKGRIGMRTREEDFVSHLFVASTHAYIMIFSDRGRVYWLKVHEIPDVGPDGKGKAIANLVSMEEGERIAALLAVKEFEDDKFIVMGTRSGVVKKTELSAFSNPRAGGIIAMGVEEGDAVIAVQRHRRQRARSSSARATAWRSASRKTDVRSMGRTAYGVRGITLRDDDDVVAMEVREARRHDPDGHRARLRQAHRARRIPRAVARRRRHHQHPDHRPQRPGRRRRVRAGRRRADADHAAGHDPADADQRHPRDRPRDAGRAADRHRRRRQGRLDRAARRERRRRGAGRRDSRNERRCASSWSSRALRVMPCSCSRRPSSSPRRSSSAPSRLRDRTALQKIATVIFDPRRRHRHQLRHHGVVDEQARGAIARTCRSAPVQLRRTDRRRAGRSRSSDRRSSTVDQRDQGRAGRSRLRLGITHRRRAARATWRRECRRSAALRSGVVTSTADRRAPPIGFDRELQSAKCTSQPRVDGRQRRRRPSAPSRDVSSRAVAGSTRMSPRGSGEAARAARPADQVRRPASTARRHVAEPPLHARAGLNHHW